MNTRQQSYQQFTKRLLRWYSHHCRDLPWRSTADPYAILVSEVMLQQTQVDRVIPYFQQWMQHFPTMTTLAHAPTNTILQTWKGLGYNRRALYLQRAAQMIINEYSGVFPQTVKALNALPGVGPYTSRAIACFAFNADVPIVDTNVTRVVGRVFIGFKKIRHTPPQHIWKLALQLIPKKGKTYTFNQALMDFGATVCTLQKPHCNSCPLQQQCQSFPKIQSAPAHTLRYHKTPHEKKYFGQPRRIWRGKILRFIASQEPTGATLTSIGHAIQLNFTAKRIPWLQSTVQTLLTDGLAVQQGKWYHLPH